MDRKLADRIKHGIRACLEARGQGRDVSDWLDHLFGLIDLLEEQSRTVTVRMGRYGFCNCLVSHALCGGCWKVKEACACMTVTVNPGDLINEEYARLLRRVNVPTAKQEPIN